MTQIPAPKDLGTKLYLLTIQGTFKTSTLAEARETHNATAGSDASMNASRALGDLSHNVYVRAEDDSQVLFVDVWNSISGLGQFFADPHVQQGGEKIFAEREPVVWMAAEGLPRFYLPAPHAANERVVGLIRGKVKSLAQAREVLQIVAAKGMNAARRHGHLSRDYYVRADGGDGAELLGMDVWTSYPGAGEFYSKVEDMGALSSIFDGRPDASVWRQPAGTWIEW